MLTKVTYFFFPLSLSCAAFAQQQDSLRLQNKAQEIGQKADSLSNQLSTDTLTQKAKKKLARLQAKKLRAQQKVEKFKNENRLAKLQYQANQKLDSLRPRNIGNQAISKVQHLADSVAPTKLLSSYQQKMDSLQTKLSAKVDSLTNFKLPDIRLTKSIDSLQQKIDNLKSQGLFKEAKKAEKKLADLQTKAKTSIAAGQQKITSLQKGVNGKLDMFNKEGGKLGNVNLPDVNSKLPNFPSVGNGINAPQLNTQLPSVNGLPNMNGKVGNMSLPSLSGKTNAALPNTPTVNTGAGTGNIGLPAIDLKNIGLGDVGKGLTDVSTSTKEIGKYTEGVKNITKDGLNDEKLKKEMEANAANLAGGKALETQLTDIEKQKAMVEKWNSDPEYRKEMAVNQAKEQATNHFAGKEKELLAAIDQLSQAKAKIKDAEQVVDMFKKSANPMKGRSFRERLDLGVSLQLLSRSDVLMTDFNPYAGYRISGRFTAGIGWVQRLPLSTKNYSVVELEDVYGPRTYLQFKIKGSAFVKAEVEFLNEFERVAGQGPSAEKGRQWITDYLVGYKQSFKFSKKMGGHVQILYNLFDPFHQSPYFERVNIRFGFEFPQRKNK